MIFKGEKVNLQNPWNAAGRSNAVKLSEMYEFTFENGFNVGNAVELDPF